MKNFFIPILLLTVIVIIVSCSKQYSSVTVNRQDKDRIIRFQLYTNQNFSGNTSVINFSIFIRTVNRTLLDSSLAQMKLEDIPDAAHKLVIEKNITWKYQFRPGSRVSL